MPHKIAPEFLRTMATLEETSVPMAFDAQIDLLAKAPQLAFSPKNSYKIN